MSVVHIYIVERKRREKRNAVSSVVVVVYTIHCIERLQWYVKHACTAFLRQNLFYFLETRDQ